MPMGKGFRKKIPIDSAWKIHCHSLRGIHWRSFRFVIRWTGTALGSLPAEINQEELPCFVCGEKYGKTIVSDWSSDVCSSDLYVGKNMERQSYDSRYNRLHRRLQHVPDCHGLSVIRGDLLWIWFKQTHLARCEYFWISKGIQDPFFSGFFYGVHSLWLSWTSDYRRIN